MASDDCYRAGYHVFYHIKDWVPIDCIGDQFAVIQIQDGRQVYLYPEQVELRHICNKLLMRRIGDKVPLKKIRCNLSHLPLI